MKNESIMDLFSLNEKIACITGGYGYIGKKLANALSDAGAIVYVLGRSINSFNEVFSNKPDVYFVSCDLSKSDDIKQAFVKLKEYHNSIDILINNAFYVSTSGGFDNESDADIELTLDGTVGQIYRVIREALPLLKTSASGRIVNISSMYGSVSPVPEVYSRSEMEPNPLMYGAGKAAVEQLTRYFATFLSPYNITVNALAPGAFPDISKVNNKKFITELEKRIPLNRIGEPSDLIAGLLFICGEGARYTTGQVIHIDGGWTIV